jgi:hypothetical protein
MILNFVGYSSEGDTEAQFKALLKYFAFNDTVYDIIFCASIDNMDKALQAKEKTNKPLVVYCWDYYKWAHEGKHPYHDWKKYAEMMCSADLVIVPSYTQQLRLKELLGIDSEVVRTGFPTYEAEVIDNGFILDPLRYYPEENRTWAEEAAAKLGIVTLRKSFASWLHHVHS